MEAESKTGGATVRDDRPCPAQPKTSPPERQRLRRALRIAAWNALLLLAAAALIALAAETYLRRAIPFWSEEHHIVLVPRVGFLWEPHTENRSTNRLDYWTVSRANSLGFLDREPPNEQDAAGCRIAVIGDSFVEAWEVPIAQKFHVRLEELAAAALPRLGIAASAFGHSATGQIQQLAFYDEFARHLRPKLLVLVFVANDFMDNAPLTRALKLGWDPQRLPYSSAARLADGTMELRPPHADPWKFRLPHLPARRPPWGGRALVRATEISRFALWLKYKTNIISMRALRGQASISEQQNAWAEELRQRPAYTALFTGWRPPLGAYSFEASNLPPLYEDALDYTLFALEQFKQRADRDGAKLVILASHSTKIAGTRTFERMNAMAAALDIPVIDQADYILRQGAKLEDAHWRHDIHWSPAGHRWAAEALFEWLRDNREVCADPEPASPPEHRE